MDRLMSETALDIYPSDAPDTYVVSGEIVKPKSQPATAWHFRESTRSIGPDARSDPSGHRLFGPNERPQPRFEELDLVLVGRKLALELFALTIGNRERDREPRIR
jgi:hypothetical protein